METKLLIKEKAVKDFEVAFKNSKEHSKYANVLLKKFDEEYWEATIAFSDVQFLFWLGRYYQLGIDIREIIKE